MKKHGLFGALVLAVLCFVVAFIVAVNPAHAQGVGNTQIPSSASGDYVGNGWNCRVLAYATAAAPATHRTLELQCSGPDNRPRLAAAVSLGCPGGAPIALTPQAGVPTSTPVFRLIAYASDQITATIDGLTVYLERAQTLASPAPYAGCAPVTKR